MVGSRRGSTRSGKTGESHDGATRNDANNTTNNDTARPTQNVFPCGTCNINIGEEDSLECDRCQTWTHGSTQCFGLPRQVFQMIIKHNNDGVTYVCTECRLRGNSRPHNQQNSGHSQLFETVKALRDRVVFWLGTGRC